MDECFFLPSFRISVWWWRCVHAFKPAVPEVSGISSSQTSNSRGLSLSSWRQRAVVLQKLCSDRPIYFCLMNRAFTTHLAASNRSVKGTLIEEQWNEKELEEGVIFTVKDHKVLLS